MRVAVAGGTGLVGSAAVAALERTGHAAVPLARSVGVDLISGDGLEVALQGADAVIDATNTAAMERDEAVTFFGTATGNLLAAEERAGVRHHVLLSIVGVDRVEGNPHYAGKVRQEELVQAGTIPWTVLRATQFYEFPEMVVQWMTQDGRAAIPPLLVQPASASDVAAELARTAVAEPLQRMVEVAGPNPEDFVDLARRALAAHGRSVTLVPSWRDGPFDARMAGEVLLPGPDARITPTTFDEWLGASASG